ncbi:MAG: dipeptide/oligopeptide/nickel ABC transporter ATP-binding protein, partial [Victivallaceae bacterium]|nr:dipeptide/oligopeptide/nickel ABC transporter ATP-binding protein [Victivallaceae bacterium]
MSARLETQDLKVHFGIGRTFLGKPKKVLKALDGVSLALESGKIVALVGESGCGKSTLGRTLVRLERPTAGTIQMDHEDVTNLSGKALRAYRSRVQMIFQDPYGSLDPRMSVESMLDEVVKLHYKANRAERLTRCTAALRQVGLDETALPRFSHQFSGGQRQRIGIARALVLQPDFIV